LLKTGIKLIFHVFSKELLHAAILWWKNKKRTTTLIGTIVNKATFSATSKPMFTKNKSTMWGEESQNDGQQLGEVVERSRLETSAIKYRIIINIIHLYLIYSKYIWAYSWVQEKCQANIGEKKTHDIQNWRQVPSRIEPS
jgi:hypothetical protein